MKNYLNSQNTISNLETLGHLVYSIDMNDISTDRDNDLFSTQYTKKPSSRLFSNRKKFEAIKKNQENERPETNRENNEYLENFFKNNMATSAYNNHTGFKAYKNMSSVFKRSIIKDLAT